VDHVCWTMSGEVRRVGLRVGRFVEVGLRAGRFVEAGPRAGRFVGASYILSPWSIICVTCRLKNLGVIMCWPRII